MPKNNIDNIFKKAFNEGEVPKPSDDDWKAMLGVLTKVGLVSKIPFWKTYKFLASVAVATILPFIVYYGNANTERESITKKSIAVEENFNKDEPNNCVVKDDNLYCESKTTLHVNEESVINEINQSETFSIDKAFAKKDNTNSTLKSTNFSNRRNNNFNSNNINNSISKTSRNSNNSNSKFYSNQINKLTNKNANINNNRENTFTTKSLMNYSNQGNQIQKNGSNHTFNNTNTLVLNNNNNNNNNTNNTKNNINGLNKNITSTNKHFNSIDQTISSNENINSSEILKRNILTVDFLAIKGLEQENDIDKVQAINDSTTTYFKSKKSNSRQELAYIKPYFSIDYAFYSGLKDSSIATLTAITTNEMKFTTGVLGGVNLWKGLYLESGILFSNKGTSIWDFDKVDNNLNKTAKYNIKGQHIEIPIKLRYKMTEHFFSFYGSAGAQLKFNISTNDSYYEFTDNEILKSYRVSPNSNSMGISLLGNIGIELNLLPQLSFFIEPEIRYSLTPILMIESYIITPINPFQHSFGIGVGLNYKFSR